MSTKAIREALEELLFLGGDSKRTCATYDAAIVEARRIEDAAKTLSIHYTATIRAEGMPNTADVLESIAREAP